MSFSFENQGTHTYLVHTVAESDIIDSMSLGMLTNNKIPGLAHTLFTQMDSVKYIKYDVSAKISVKQFFAGQVNKKRLMGVFHGVVDALLAAEEYMLDVNSILLDLDYIFADVSTCETMLICLPVISNKLSPFDVRAFFKDIMFSTQFDQTENCDHVAKIINYLNSTPVFSLDEFKKLIDTIDCGTADAHLAQQPTSIRAQMQAMPHNTQPTVQQAAQPVVSTGEQRQTSVATPQSPTVTQGVVRPQESPAKAQVPVVQSSVTSDGQTAGAAKKMTMLNLLMHYNKENAALYKAQKQTEKNVKGVDRSVDTKANNIKQASIDFAIPGQSSTSNQGFAVPGRQAPSQGASVVSPMPAPNGAPTVGQEAKTYSSPQVNTNGTPKPSFAPTYTSPQMPQGQPMNFGETTVLGGSRMGETTVLGATPEVQPKPHLIRAKNNEKIDLNKPVFRVGKEKSYVDYFIGDNSAISRSHANIISRDGEYYVVDTNSTNHTYVNGEMIQSNSETKIDHGAKIKFANEEFEFKLY